MASQEREAGGQLIVRVKRRRGDEPLDILRVMEEHDAELDSLTALVQEGDDIRRTKRAATKRSKSLAKQFAQLTHSDSAGDNVDEAACADVNDSEPQKVQSIILHRVGTVTSNDDIITLSMKRSRQDDDATESTSTSTSSPSSALVKSPPSSKVNGMARQRVLVQRGRKALRSDQDGSFIVVDAQMDSMPANEHTIQSPSTMASGTKSPSPSRGQAILNPATRKLQKGIELAMLQGDFTGIAEALPMGPNINHQVHSIPASSITNTNTNTNAATASVTSSITTSNAPFFSMAGWSDGQEGNVTALMAASYHANVRVAKRLIDLGADVFIKDSRGRSALEYARDTARVNRGGKRAKAAAMEIILMLQKAALRIAQQRPYIQQETEINKETKEKAENVATMDEGDNDDYVFDIFVMQTNQIKSSHQKNEDAAGTTTQGPASTSHEEEGGAVLAVGGIRINGDTVELLEGYDSDYSDLADDEDPDSNDERYFGNDYPEEEDSEEDNDDEEGGLGGGRWVDDDDDSDEERAPRFEKPTIGRVLRTHIPSDPFGVFHTSKMDQQALQQLWGEGGDEDDEVAGKMGDRLYGGGRSDYMGSGQGIDEQEMEDELFAHRQRVKNMRQRTGMDFAANVREFDDRGLPKFGADLSDTEYDCEGDDDVQGSRAGRFGVSWGSETRGGRPKPPKDTVAFDPELDMDDD